MKQKFRSFFNAAQNRRPRKAEVSGIEYAPFDGRVRSIVRTSMMSMNSQLAEGIDAIEGINEKMDQMLEKQDQTLGKLDGMLDKQDQTLGKLDGMLDKQGQMLDRQDQTLDRLDCIIDKQDETNAEIRDLRGNLARRDSGEHLIRMEKDIRTIKSKLSIR